MCWARTADPGSSRPRRRRDTVEAAGSAIIARRRNATRNRSTEVPSLSCSGGELGADVGAVTRKPIDPSPRGVYDYHELAAGPATIEARRTRHRTVRHGRRILRV